VNDVCYLQAKVTVYCYCWWCCLWLLLSLQLLRLLCSYVRDWSMIYHYQHKLHCFPSCQNLIKNTIFSRHVKAFYLWHLSTFRFMYCILSDISTFWYHDHCNIFSDTPMLYAHLLAGLPAIVMVHLSVCHMWISLKLSGIDIWLLENSNRNPGFLIRNLPSDLRSEIQFHNFGCF